jgi:serine/threonine protein kinase
MRKNFVAIIISITTLLAVAAVFSVQSGTTKIQWFAAVLISIVGMLAAIAQILGLFPQIFTQKDTKSGDVEESRERLPSSKNGLPKIDSKDYVMYDQYLGDNRIEYKDLQIRGFQVVGKISETGLSSVYFAQKSDGFNFILKKRKKILKAGLNYPKLTLDPKRFAIPVKCWTDSDFTYEAIPYREGWSLSEVVKLNNGNVCSDLLDSWAVELLELLTKLHLHKPTIIIRDLKPENILVLPKSYKLVLIDLTSAIYFRKGVKHNIIGTSGYMAPEQAKGNPCPASDLYALAATLVTLNTGMMPPNHIDRLRGKEHFKLNNISDHMHKFFPKIASLDPDKRPVNAKNALDLWKSYVPQTTALGPTFKLFHFPDGNSIELYETYGEVST